MFCLSNLFGQNEDSKEKKSQSGKCQLFNCDLKRKNHKPNFQGIVHPEYELRDAE